jgi:hypothetical protein
MFYPADQISWRSPGQPAEQVKTDFHQQHQSVWTSGERQARIDCEGKDHLFIFAILQKNILLSVFTTIVLSPKRKGFGDIIATPQVTSPSTTQRLPPQQRPFPQRIRISYRRALEHIPSYSIRENADS